MPLGYTEPEERMNLISSNLSQQIEKAKQHVLLPTCVWNIFSSSIVL